MLDISRFREVLAGKIAKIFIVFIALTFIVIALSDIVSGNNGKVIAFIGDDKITEEEHNQKYAEFADRITRAYGENASLILQQVDYKEILLKDMILERIYKQWAQKLNLIIDDSVALSQLMKYPEFQDDEGNFDRGKLEDVIKNQGVNIGEFLQALSNEVQISFIKNSLSLALIGSNKKIIDMIYKYQIHYRNIDLLSVDPTVYLSSVEEPTKKDLESIYEKNKALFFVPKKYKISSMNFGCNALVQENIVTASDDELLEFYDGVQSNYSDPETREVGQFIFDTQEQATNYLAKLGEKDVKDIKDNKNYIAMGDVKKEDLVAEIQDVIFQLGVGDLSQVIKTDAGWHIFFVHQITSTKNYSFTQLNKEQQTEVKNLFLYDKACDLMANKFSEIEDQVAANNDLELLTKSWNISVEKFEISEGASLDEIKLNFNSNYKSENELIKDFYARTEQVLGNPNQVVSFVPTGDVYYLFKIDQIEPSYTLPIAEVQDELKVLYKNQQALLKAEQTIEKLVESYDTNKVIDILKERGVHIQKSVDVNRNGVEEIEDFNQELVRAIFATQKNSMTNSIFDKKKNKYYLAIVNDIINPIAENNDINTEIEAIKDQLKGKLKEIDFKILEQSYINILYNIFDVRIINKKVLNDNDE